MHQHPLSRATGWLVRVATAADAQALDRMPLTPAGHRMLEAAAGDGSSIIHVVELKSALIGVGYCGIQRSENLAIRGYDAEIRLLYVLPDFQRRGIGAQLLASMARALAAGGFLEATSWVARESAAARRFYAHYGGRVVAEQERRERTIDDDNTVKMEFAYAWTQLGVLQQVAAAAASH